jgi:hypothetical protein
MAVSFLQPYDIWSKLDPLQNRRLACFLPGSCVFARPRASRWARQHRIVGWARLTFAIAGDCMVSVMSNHQSSRINVYR